MGYLLWRDILINLFNWRYIHKTREWILRNSLLSITGPLSGVGKFKEWRKILK